MNIYWKRTFEKQNQPKKKLAERMNPGIAKSWLKRYWWAFVFLVEVQPSNYGNDGVDTEWGLCKKNNKKLGGKVRGGKESSKTVQTFLGLPVWHSGLSLSLWCRRPLPACNLASLLLVPFPAKAPGKAVEEGPSTWTPPPLWESRMQFQVPGPSMAQP